MGVNSLMQIEKQKHTCVVEYANNNEKMLGKSMVLVVMHSTVNVNEGYVCVSFFPCRKMYSCGKIQLKKIKKKEKTVSLDIFIYILPWSSDRYMNNGFHCNVTMMGIWI